MPKHDDAIPLEPTAEAGGRRMASEWRDAKGTDPAMYAVAKITFRADNRLLTEAEYDAAVKAAGEYRLT